VSDIKLIQSEQVRFNESPKDPLITLNQIQTLPDQAKTIIRVHEQQEAASVQTFVSGNRPDDCAVAVADVSKLMFGVTLQNGTGFRPAETKRVQVSLTETREVPWGPNSIPALDNAQMEVGYTNDPEKGLVGQVQIYAKNKFTPLVKEFFDQIEKRLQTHSIYRGKAIVGTEWPEFYDLGRFRPELVTHSDLVAAALDVFLFTRLRNREVLDAMGEQFGVKVLLHGPYGTGKTSTALQAACIAAQHKIGFVHNRPGVDDVYETLRTAKLLQPCVVLIEDVDVIAPNTLSETKLQRLLEAFDGATSKGSEVILMMTTNHRDRIHPGLFRPGRTDMEVLINELDRHGVEKLVRAHMEPLLADDVNFDRIYAETCNSEGKGTFTGSHVESMVRHARMAGLHRTGKPVFTLTTEDFIAAAAPVKMQQLLQAEAVEGEKPPAVDRAIGAIVEKQIRKVVESDHFVELLTESASNGVYSQMDTIRAVAESTVERGLDNTVLMDPDKEVVRGALEVQ
jgi:transitional endoplasmic reticulum ATPase